MSLTTFFSRYTRHYVGWGLLAAAGIVLFAAATAATASLIKPIFAEVLLAGDHAPDPLGGGLSALAPAASAAAPRPAAPRAPAGEAAVGGAVRRGGGGRGGATDPISAWKRRFNLSQQLDRGYASVKRHLGIGPRQVVYFVPILFVLVFFIRSFADFLSGYAF